MMIRERSASACRLLAKRTIGARPRARSDPPGLGQAARDAGSRPTHEPEMVMRAVRNVGEAVEVMRRRSDAMASMPFNMASSVGFISAVKVKLSLGHGQSSKGHVGVGVSRMGVANITEVALGVGVVISTNTAGPQDAKNNRISPIGNNRKMLGNIFLMFFSS